MNRVLGILAMLTLVWVTVPVIADRDGRRAGPRPKDGAYNLAIAGFIQSSGDVSGSTVSGNQVNLQAAVVSSETGEKGVLSASGLKIKGRYFSGKGTVLGQSAQFDGRIDFPDDDKELAIRGVRMVCNVKTADGNYARLVGYVPALAAAKDKIDAENDRDRGRDRPAPRK
jgi:hypothetical protein